MSQEYDLKKVKDFLERCEFEVEFLDKITLWTYCMKIAVFPDHALVFPSCEPVKSLLWEWMKFSAWEQANSLRSLGHQMNILSEFAFGTLVEKAREIDKQETIGG